MHKQKIEFFRAVTRMAVCDMVVTDGVLAQAPPIMRKMIGRRMEEVEEYLKRSYRAKTRRIKCEYRDPWRVG